MLITSDSSVGEHSDLLVAFILVVQTYIG